MRTCDPKICLLRSMPFLVSQISSAAFCQKCHFRSVALPIVTLTNLVFSCPAVLTLCACTPPLEEVLRLWDYLLACGVHLNIICVVAQLLLMREELMNSPRWVLSHVEAPTSLLESDLCGRLSLVRIQADHFLFFVCSLSAQ